MRKLLTALFGFATVATALTAQANQEHAVNTGGFGKWLIDSLFESGSVGDMTQQPGMIGTVIMPLSLMCFVMVLFLITLKSIQHFIIVSQAKNLEASPVSMTWAPVHILIAITLALPMPSGYSMGQYGAIWLAEQSNALGNMTAQRATSFISNRGMITPPPMPSMQAFTNAIAASATCKVMWNKYGEHMESLGNNKSWVKENQRSGYSEPGTDKITASEEYQSYVISYERKTAVNGQVLSSAINNFCGKMVIQYKNPPDDQDLPNTLPIFRADPVDCGDGESNFCFQDGETVERAIWDFMYTANETIAAALLDDPNNGVASTNPLGADTDAGSAGNNFAAKIAGNLLYDLDKRFAGATDAEAMEDAIAMLADEDAKISAAVEAAEDLFEKTRDRTYDAYATAINSANNEGPAGDWIENLDRAGWPLLGLYWFQFTNTSNAVGQASELTFQYTGGMDKYLTALYAATEDAELVRTLRNRYSKFQKAFHREIQNTRFDSQPLVDESRPDAAALAGVTAEDLEALNAADLRKSIPAMFDAMIEQAGGGNENVSGDPWGIDFLNDWSRNWVFPLIVSTLKEGDIVTSMVNTGHNIIAISEFVYLANLMARSAEAASDAQGGDDEEANDADITSAWSWITSPIDTTVALFNRAISMLSIMLSDFASYWKYLFFAGLFLAFYLPSMIMIQWLIGFITWVIYLLEATVIIPIWSLLFVGEMGEKSFSPQTARQGFVHLLSILLYPSLMVIGFVFGLKVIDLVSPFIIDFLIIGFLNATDGYAFGLVSFAAGLIILAVAAYQIIIRVFSIVLEFNDRAMGWIGQRAGYGEASGEQGARGGFVGAINEGKMEGRMNRTPGKRG
jgi:conjugal transfer/type IV secretion protein DotA/TraY